MDYSLYKSGKTWYQCLAGIFCCVLELGRGLVIANLHTQIAYLRNSLRLDVVGVVVTMSPSGNCLYERTKMSRRDEEFYSESGGIRLSLVIVDSHLLTGAPLKGGCRCPQLTYCRPLSNDRRGRMWTYCQAAVSSPTLSWVYRSQTQPTA